MGWSRLWVLIGPCLVFRVLYFVWLILVNVFSSGLGKFQSNGCKLNAFPSE
jgi:hypothetical protein